MNTIEQLATDNGLTIVVRGTQYARLMLGDTELAVFHEFGWEPAARGWFPAKLMEYRELCVAQHQPGVLCPAHHNGQAVICRELFNCIHSLFPLHFFGVGCSVVSG